MICAAHNVGGKWVRERIWISPQPSHTATGNGQPLWGNSIHLSSTLKKIESRRHFRWFNGVNMRTVQLHDHQGLTMDYWVQCKISHFSRVHLTERNGWTLAEILKVICFANKPVMDLASDTLDTTACIESHSLGGHLYSIFLVAQMYFWYWFWL